MGTAVEKQKKTAPKNTLLENKSKTSLLPFDILQELLTPAYFEGTLKYERESWRLGFPASKMMDACLRHLIKFYYEGEDFDKETKEQFNIEKHHLGAAIFCLLSMYWSIKVDKELDDRPKNLIEKEK